MQELFEAALTRSGDERRTFLVDACGDDDELLRQVNTLLDADAQTGALLDASIGAARSLGEPELAPGTVIEQYEVEECVGSGGYGSVYRARHAVIKKAAAIKVLHLEHSHSPALVRRFITEARAVNEIGHPNIIDIFAFGETEDGRLYYIMEYVDAPSLDEVIRARGRLSLAEAAPILRGLAAALDAAHAAGIVHRDLKPGNVIVREEDGAFVPKLVDFGIAKLANADGAPIERTQSGQMIGTPAYMAPEQIRGQDIDARTDVYAFGVLTYLLLTGVAPVQGDSAFDVMLAHTQETPRPPSQLVSSLGPAADAAILAMLAKDSSERPATLAAAVEPLLSEAARPRGASGSGGWVLRGIAASAVIAVAIAGWQLFSGRGGSAETDPSVTKLGSSSATPDSSPAKPDASPSQPDPPQSTPSRPPPAAAAVSIEFTGTPDGTTVRGPDGRVLGTMPGPLSHPAGDAPVSFTFERPDGRKQTRSVTPDRDQVIELEWSSPAKARPKQKRRLHPDLETPFPK